VEVGGVEAIVIIKMRISGCLENYLFNFLQSSLSCKIVMGWQKQETKVMEGCMAACPFGPSSPHFFLLCVMCKSQMAPISILFPIFIAILTPCEITHP
jgi:hypothetical protein